MGRDNELELRDLAGGLNTKTLSANKIADNETPNCSDVMFDRGSIVKRDGYKRLVNSATCDPSIHFNRYHGHLRIPAHADFDYGTNWEIVLKVKLDSLPSSDRRQSLYCHGFAGGTSTSFPTPATWQRAVWFWVEDDGTLHLAVTYTNNADQTIATATGISADTAYAIHFGRDTTGATGKLFINAWDLDSNSQGPVNTGVDADESVGQLDMSDYPINVGAAPVFDVDLSSIGTDDIGVDNTGGSMYSNQSGTPANHGSTSNGPVQEHMDGWLGEVQIFIGHGAKRTVDGDARYRLDTQDGDVGSLVGYWMCNDGSGTTVTCNTNYSISNASSKNGTLTGYRPTWVTGLVGNAKTKHALRFDGFENVMRVQDRFYVAANPGIGGSTSGSNRSKDQARWLESMCIINLDFDDDGHYEPNPWTFEFAFEFHKNSDEYNVDRVQTLCAWRYRFSDSPNSTTMDSPFLQIYIDTSEVLKIDVARSYNAASGNFTYDTMSLGTVTKDTTYHVAVMRYNAGLNYVCFLDGVYKDESDDTNLPQVNNVGIENPQLDIYFGANGDHMHEWDSTSNGHRTSACPSNCTIDEIRLWAWEDADTDPVGVRTPNLSGTATDAVPAGEKPTAENLILKYHDKEIRDAEIRDRSGLWLYFPFYEDVTDYYEVNPTVHWTKDESRYRMFPGKLFPSSDVTTWDVGFLTLTSIDTDYANNTLVHNPTDDVEGIVNYVKEDDTQTLVFTQSSGLWTYSSGDNAYTQQDRGIQGGNLASFAIGKDYCYVVHAPRRPMRWDGTNFYTMGIAAPTSPVHAYYNATNNMRNAEEGGLLFGRYYTYRYTYYNKNKNIESDASPESAAFYTNPTLEGLAATNDVEINLDIPRSSDPQVTHYRLYRSEPLSTQTGDTAEYSSAVGSAFFLVGEITATGTGNSPMLVGTQGDTPLVDNWWEGLPEAGLGYAMPLRKAPPPKDPRYITFWRSRTWCARTTDHPSRLYFSEVGEPESYHAKNFLDFDEGDGQAITAIAPLFNYLLVFKGNSIYSVTEDSGVQPSTVFFPFSKYKLHTNVGAEGHFGVQKLDENAVIFVSQKGVYLTNGVEVQYLSEKVENIFRDEVSRANLMDAFATIYKRRNQMIICMSTDGVDNDIALVYDYVRKTWTRFNLHARCMTQTEDANGVERIFFGGVSGSGYLNRWDTGETDGAEFIRPATPTEPDKLTGNPSTGGTTTTLINTAANWNSVTGDKLRGMLMKIINPSGTTNHVIYATDQTGSGDDRIYFYPPLASATATTDNYIISGIDGTWRSKIFDFGSLADQKALQDLILYMDTKAHGGVITVGLATDFGSFTDNTNTAAMTSIRTEVPFKGIGWASAGGTSRARFFQFRLRNRNPDEGFSLHDFVLRLEPAER